MARDKSIERRSMRRRANDQVAMQIAISQLGESEKTQLLHHLHAQQAELKLQNKTLSECQSSLQDSLEVYLQKSLRQSEVSRHIITAQEKERRRLALDLHDIVSPSMAAIKANLFALRTSLPPSTLEEVAGRLSDIDALLDDTTTRLRELGNELRPVILDYLGLYAALENYTEQYAARTGVSVEITGSNDESKGPRLVPDVESKLFRIAQEALTNSAKHAKATKILIVLEHDGQHGTMSITDNGIGFDPAMLGSREGGAGLGILTMKERAEFVGGVCRIESEPGAGTRVVVDF